MLDSKQQKLIGNALKNILASKRFEHSPKLSAFLRYVVEQTAQGNASRIKAYTVAVDALGKSSDFDPQNDPVVRVLAIRLRSVLTDYNADNPDEPVIISMSRGTYVPTFKGKAFCSDDGVSRAELTELSSSDQGSSATSLSATETIAENSNEKIGSAAQSDHTRNDSHDAAGSDASAFAQYTGQYSRVEQSLPAQNLKPFEQSPIQKAKTSNTDSVLAALRSTWPKELSPSWTLAAGMLVVLGAGILFKAEEQTAEPRMQAALSSAALSVSGPTNTGQGTRPDAPRVYIRATDQSNLLESSLAVIVNGAISNATHISVRSISESEQVIQFWPEDYVLYLATQILPDRQSQVNIQLIEALTGRIVTKESLVLQTTALNALTHEELASVANLSKNLVSADGPLIKDYANKLNN